MHPLAVRAMEELGISISAQHSKTIDDLEEHDFDYVVSTCDEAAEACPVACVEAGEDSLLYFHLLLLRALEAQALPPPDLAFYAQGMHFPEPGIF